jgi:hypothetical protein
MGDNAGNPKNENGNAHVTKKNSVLRRVSMFILKATLGFVLLGILPVLKLSFTREEAQFDQNMADGIQYEPLESLILSSRLAKYCPVLKSNNKLDVVRFNSEILVPYHTGAFADALSFMGRRSMAILDLLRGFHDELAVPEPTSEDFGGGPNLATSVAFHRAIREIEGRSSTPNFAQAIRGLTFDLSVAWLNDSDVIEWTAYCSELCEFAAIQDRRNFRRSFFRPDHGAHDRSQATLSMLADLRPKSLEHAVENSQSWREKGILVQEVGRSYRILKRIENRERTALTRSDFLCQAYRMFQEYCMDNRWSLIALSCSTALAPMTMLSTKSS